MSGQISIYRHIQERIILAEVDEVFRDIRIRFLPDKQPIQMYDIISIVMIYL
jgi:hypothetical protein